MAVVKVVHRVQGDVPDVEMDAVKLVKEIVAQVVMDVLDAQKAAVVVEVIVLVADNVILAVLVIVRVDVQEVVILVVLAVATQIVLARVIPDVLDVIQVLLIVELVVLGIVIQLVSHVQDALDVEEIVTADVIQIALTVVVPNVAKYATQLVAVDAGKVVKDAIPHVLDATQAVVDVDLLA